MIEKIKKKLPIISNIIVGIITFFIICPIKYNKIALFVFVLLFLILQFFINKEKMVEFYLKPNLLIYSLYGFILIHFMAQFIFRIPYINVINDIACSFIITFYLYIYKLKDIDILKIIIYVSIITIIFVNIITIVAIQINPDISRIISGSNNEMKSFGVR